MGSWWDVVRRGGHGYCGNCACPDRIAHAQHSQRCGFGGYDRRHYEAILGFYGTELGVRVARKHLGWYMDQAKTDRQMRRALLTANDPRDVFVAYQIRNFTGGRMHPH
jgi:tRNA-dihydrouridine synthase